MNNIDILERVCECRRFSGVFTDVECIFKAIETLIAENKELKEEIEELKEKNKKIDEFCRKELAFERRLKRENRQPDEFNQGRFYVSENIRKIIEEEENNVK